MTENQKWNEKLVAYWRLNIKNNLKKISANLGSWIMTIVGLVILGYKMGYAWNEIFIIVIFATQPFFNTWINIIFKGEAEISNNEIDLLKQQLEFSRELAEWKLNVVALKASADWEKANEMLEKVAEMKC